MFLFTLHPLLFLKTIRGLLPLQFFWKVGALLRLCHILCLRRSLKTDMRVYKNSPTRYIVEWAWSSALKNVLNLLPWIFFFLSPNAKMRHTRGVLSRLWVKRGFIELRWKLIYLVIIIFGAQGKIVPNNRDNNYNKSRKLWFVFGMSTVCLAGRLGQGGTNVQGDA